MAFLESPEPGNRNMNGTEASDRIEREFRSIERRLAKKEVE